MSSENKGFLQNKELEIFKGCLSCKFWREDEPFFTEKKEKAIRVNRFDNSNWHFLEEKIFVDLILMRLLQRTHFKQITAKLITKYKCILEEQR